MKCPKCTGLLIQEEIQEHSGRFQGWRCIQCGLRLDQTIVQNRHDGQTDAAEDLPGASVHNSSARRPRTSSRQKRPAGKT